jgi:hypothetical protein
MRKSKAVPKPVKAVCIPCAAKAKAAKIPPVPLPSKNMGKPILVGGEPDPPVPPRRIGATEKAPTPCELVSSSITCSHHGRKAANGILCVVPDSYLGIGDRIECAAVLAGGCGQHVEWSISGMWTSTEHGNNTSVLAKTLKPALLEGWLGLEHITPQTYQIQAVACEGETPSVEVRAYPPDKWGGKIDFNKEVCDRIKHWLSHVPIPDDAKKELESGWFMGSLEYQQQWKEDKESNRAFCESTVAGSFDPLFGAKLNVPIYPPSLIPPPLLQVGVYLGLEGGFGLKIELFWEYWPDTDESNYEKAEGSLLGSITGKLYVKLFVVNDNVVNAEISGSTGLKAAASVILETSPAVEFSIQWTGLDAGVSIKAAWGWIEFDRTYPLMRESDIERYERPFGANATAASGE